MIREWTQDKPDKPCIFLTRNMVSRSNEGIQDFEYAAYQLCEINAGDGSYIAWCDLEGNEYGDLGDLYAEHYYVVDEQ